MKRPEKLKRIRKGVFEEPWNIELLQDKIDILPKSDKKKKILFVGEASFLQTGFSTYWEAVITRLYNTGKYEISEMGSYAKTSDPRGKNLPWTFYGVIPEEADKIGTQQYQKHYQEAQFGKLAMDPVLAKFQPDVVCTPPGNLVMTENGYIPIENISIGDKVLTHTGKFQKVTKKYKRSHNGDICKIHSNGICDPLVLTSNHPIYTYKNKKQTAQKKSLKKIHENDIPEFIPASDVVEKDIVITPTLNIKTSQQFIDLRDYLDNYKQNNDGTISPHNGHEKDKTISPIIKITSNVARLIAYIVGDGSINKGAITICFKNSEKKLVEDSVRIANSIGWGAKFDDKRNGNWTFRCNSVLLAKALKKWLFNKPYDWNTPKEIWMSSIDIKEQFLSGLIKADGHYRDDKRGIAYVTINKKMAYNVRLLWLCVGIPSTITFKPQNGAYVVNVNSQHDVKKADKFIQKYENLNITTKNKITRHPQTVQIINGNLTSRIKRKRTVPYNGIVYNLEVENDESYVLQSCVHNCTLTDRWMAYFWDQSVFRENFHWIYMACVDSYPQKWDWLATYSNVDTLLAYSHFGKKVLEEQSRTGASLSTDKIKPLNVEMVTQPGIDTSIYTPLDKDAIKEGFGIPKEFRFVGMASRNQKRKLFPRLIESFRMFKDQGGWKEDDPKRKRVKDIDNIKLLLHTCVKDVGFDIPEAISREGLNGEVFFSYICTKCGACAIRPFCGHPIECPSCKKKEMITPNTQVGFPDAIFTKWFNLLDLYIQGAIAGACLPSGEQILTAFENYKNIEDIKIGEKVLTSEGTYEKVTKINNRQYTGDIFAIQPHYINFPTKMSADHKILTIDKIKNNIKNLNECTISQAEWIEAQNINKNNHVLLYPHDTDKEDSTQTIDISQYINKNNYLITDTEIIPQGKNQFGKTGQHSTSPKIKRYIPITSNFARLIGYWIAEGSLCGRIGEITFSFHKKETEYHQDVQNLLKIIFDVDFKIRNLPKNTVSINGSSVILSEFLENFCGRIGLDRFIHPIFKNSNKQIKKSLLTCLWRGDGSNYTSNSGIIYSSYSTSSKILAFDIFNMLLSLNYIGAISGNKRHLNTEYQVRLYGKQVENFIQEISRKQNATKGRYSDKPLKHVYKDNKYLYLNIDTISKKPVENTTIYNVDVENYPSYVSSFIVHNSEMTIINAKACGAPTIVTDYAAMSEQGKNGGGAVIRCDLETESETMQWRAWFDRQDLVDKLLKIMKKPKVLKRMSNEARRCAVQYYDWDLTAKKWEYLIDRADSKNEWPKSLDTIDITTNKLCETPNLSDSDFIDNCYNEILGREPDEKGKSDWLGNLEKGQTRDKVEQFFRNETNKKNHAANLLNNKGVEVDPMVNIASDMNPKDTFRILYCMPETAGDVLISTAILSKIQDKYPHASIYVATQKRYFDILENNPCIEGVFEYDEELLNYRTPEHFGPSPGFVDICFSPFIITQKIPHWIHGGNGESLGVSYAHMCNLTMTDSEIEDKMFIDTTEVKDLPEKYITLHPKTTQDPKDYDRWAEVLERIKDISIIQVGSTNEPIFEHPCIIDFRGKTTPQQLAYVIENAELHLGVDSFPSHVARAVDTRSIILYGGTYARQGGIVNGIAIEPDNRNGCCTSCHLIECISKSQGGSKCINNINPNDVIDEIGKIISTNFIIDSKPITLSAYCIIKNGEKYEFPYVKCISEALKIVDEFVIVDGGSIDGTLEKLQEMSKLDNRIKVYQHEWDISQPDLMGQEKTYAKNLCTQDYHIQLDADEILIEPINDQIRSLIGSNSKVPIFDIPGINIYGDSKTIRIEEAIQKWRIVKSDENIIHGVHGSARELDPKTMKITFDKKISDSCEFIDKNTLEIASHAGTIPQQVANMHHYLLQLHLRKEEIPQDLIDKYKTVIKQIRESMPHTIHLSWSNLDNKEERGSFWDETWHGKNSWTHNTSSNIKQRVKNNEDLLIKFDTEIWKG